MKTCAIYYFSGTNNTKIVTGMLADELANNDYRITMQEINADLIEKGLSDVKSCDLLGIAFPVYGFGTSRIISKLINELPDADGQRTFILRTAGGYSKMNRSSSYNIINKLRKKGYKVIYDRIIVMGSNFFASYGDALNKTLYNTAKVKTKLMADELAGGTECGYFPGFLENCLTNFICFMEDHFGARQFGLSLHATKDCTKCMKCIDNCPNNNIVMKNDKIKIGTDCLLCMKCVYSCPVNAIKSMGLSFVVLKDGYDLEKIVNDDSVEPLLIDDVKDGKLNAFYEYLSQSDK